MFLTLEFHCKHLVSTIYSNFASLIVLYNVILYYIVLLYCIKLRRIFVLFRFFFVCIRFKQIFSFKTNTNTFLLSVFGFKLTNNKLRFLQKWKNNKNLPIFKLIFWLTSSLLQLWKCNLLPAFFHLVSSFKQIVTNIPFYNIREFFQIVKDPE